MRVNLKITGINSGSWHKRRKTGGKKKPIRKKRKFELGRPAANTKVRFCFLSAVLAFTSYKKCYKIYQSLPGVPVISGN